MRNAVLVPGAIVFAGLIIALAVYAVRDGGAPVLPEGDLSLVRPVSLEDHILGSPDAAVVVVEYADVDSAYSKQFNRTMEQIMTEYGEGGEVAWVYRHFPLTHIHTNAGTHAHAAECVASLAGENAFWLFISAMQSEAPGTSEFEPEGYATLLPRFEIAESAFTACMDGNAFDARIAEDAKNALDIGAEGTPYIVVLRKSGDPLSVSGSLPYTTMKGIIEEMLGSRAP